MHSQQQRYLLCCMMLHKKCVSPKSDVYKFWTQLLNSCKPDDTMTASHLLLIITKGTILPLLAKKGVAFWHLHLYSPVRSRHLLWIMLALYKAADICKKQKLTSNASNGLRCNTRHSTWTKWQGFWGKKEPFYHPGYPFKGNFSSVHPYIVMTLEAFKVLSP